MVIDLCVVYFRVWALNLVNLMVLGMVAGFVVLVLRVVVVLWLCC